MDPESDVHRLLRRDSVFAELPPEDLRQLAGECELRPLDAGSHLFHAGSPQNWVVHLAQGRMVLYRRNPARDVSLMLGVIGAPSFIGDMEWAAGFPWMVTCRAEEDSLCVLIPLPAFEARVSHHHKLCLRLYRDASARHLLTSHAAQSIALHDIRTRLLGLLVDFAREFGEPVQGGIVIQKRISLNDLAAALAVTRKTVMRNLKPLEEEGIVSRRPDNLLVLHGLESLESTLPRDMVGISSREGESITPFRHVLGKRIPKT